MAVERSRSWTEMIGATIWTMLITPHWMLSGKLGDIFEIATQLTFYVARESLVYTFCHHSIAGINAGSTSGVQLL